MESKATFAPPNVFNSELLELQDQIQEEELHLQVAGGMTTESRLNTEIREGLAGRNEHN